MTNHKNRRPTGRLPGKSDRSSCRGIGIEKGLQFQLGPAAGAETGVPLPERLRERYGGIAVRKWAVPL